MYDSNGYAPSIKQQQQRPPLFYKKKVSHPQKNDDKKGLEMPKIVKSSPTILPILSIAFLFFPIQYSSVYHHHHHGQLV